MDIDVLPIDRFGENLQEFIALSRELLTKCYEEGKSSLHPIIVELAEKFLKKYDREKLVNNFISYSYEYWMEIKKRDESFFDVHCGYVFRDLPVNYVDSFKNLLKAKDKNDVYIVVPEDRESIWVYLECLIKTAINHIHYMRKPAMKDGKRIYTANYCPNVVKIHRWAETFEIPLEWSSK